MRLIIKIHLSEVNLKANVILGSPTLTFRYWAVLIRQES